MMETVAVTLQRAHRALAPHSASPRLDAEVLLGHLLVANRVELIVRADRFVTAPLARAFDRLVERRTQGVPIAYLVGVREFWSLPLDVSPAVLVPRPETELLVEIALQLLPPQSRSTVLDLGTGSGAIALAIASERPHARVTGVDVSPAALKVAVGNARKLDLPQIRWCAGSWYEPLSRQRFDLIVANPPYVAAGDPALEQLLAEPAVALSPGPTGFEHLRAIIEGAARHLNPRGSLLLEHGSQQGGRVAELLRQEGFTEIHARVDYAGNPRVALATFHSTL